MMLLEILKVIFISTVFLFSSNPKFNVGFFYNNHRVAEAIKKIEIDNTLFNKVKNEIKKYSYYFNHRTLKYFNLSAIKSFKFKETNLPVYGRYSFLDDSIYLNLGLINDYYILETTIYHELVHRSQVKEFNYCDPIYISAIGYGDDPFVSYIDRCTEISAYYQELKYLYRTYGSNSHKFKYFLSECCYWFLDRLSYNIENYIGDVSFALKLKLEAETMER
jgi:hypothetical protein